MSNCKLTRRVLHYMLPRAVSVEAEHFSNVQKWDYPCCEAELINLCHMLVHTKAGWSEAWLELADLRP